MNPFRKIFSVIIFSIISVIFLGTTSIAGSWEYDYESEEGGWFYLCDDGTYARFGIYTIDGSLYAFDRGGYLMTDTWVSFVDDAEYYASSDGHILRNQWIDDTHYAGSDGKITSSTSSYDNSSYSDTYTSTVKTYTSEEIFAKADPYVINIPGARHMRTEEWGILGAKAFYYTNNGGYYVYFTKTPGSYELEYNKSGYY